MKGSVMFSEPQTPVINETVNISSSVSPSHALPRVVSIPSKRPSNKHFGTVVTVEVGPEKKAFVIHKGLLCFYSDYFRAAFNGSFKEAIEAKLSLPEESADLFYIVNGFLYTNQLRQDDRIGSQLTLTTLGDLWVLGDRYLMPALQNTAMDAYIKRISGKHGHIAPESIERRYRQTHAGSPLRRVFVDWQAHKLKLNKKILREWPQEALADFAIALFDMKSKHQGTNKSPEERDKCYYHVHAEGEHCELQGMEMRRHSERSGSNTAYKSSHRAAWWLDNEQQMRDSKRTVPTQSTVLLNRSSRICHYRHVIDVL